MMDLAKTAPLGSSYLKRYQILIQTLDRVWQRLIRELSPHLRAYPKWSKLKRPLREGDVGVMVDEGLRNHFPLVSIHRIDLSADGHGRRLILAQGKKTYRRSLSNFVYLFSPEESGGAESDGADRSESGGAESDGADHSERPVSPNP